MRAPILDRPGWQIVKLMRAKGISQAEVARMVRPPVDRTVVSLVIHRHPRVGPGTRQRVLDALRAVLDHGPRARGRA